MPIFLIEGQSFLISHLSPLDLTPSVSVFHSDLLRETVRGFFFVCLDLHPWFDSNLARGLVVFPVRDRSWVGSVWFLVVAPCGSWLLKTELGLRFLRCRRRRSGSSPLFGDERHGSGEGGWWISVERRFSRRRRDIVSWTSGYFSKLSVWGRRRGGVNKDPGGGWLRQRLMSDLHGSFLLGSLPFLPVFTSTLHSPLTVRRFQISR